MATLKCPICRQRTSDTAICCEHCGTEIDDSFEWISGPWTPAQLRAPTPAPEAEETADARVPGGDYAGMLRTDLRERGRRRMVIGSITVVLGVIASIASWLNAAPGGTYFIYTGAIIGGGVLFARGLYQRDVSAKPLDEEEALISAEPDAWRACPHCGSEYHPRHFRADAPHWVCSTCKGELPRPSVDVPTH